MGSVGKGFPQVGVEWKEKLGEGKFSPLDLHSFYGGNVVGRGGFSLPYLERLKSPLPTESVDRFFRALSKKC